MYCKNCGRQLKEGTRFCDRCGQSVRKNMQNSQAARHQEIKELQAERLNRKKRLAEKEARQARNRKRKKNRGTTVLFVAVILLIAVASIIIGYNIPGDDSTTNTIASSTPESSLGVQVTATPIASKSGYSEISLSGVTCPYPSDFRSNTVTGSEKLNLTDALGGSTMIVAQEGKSGEPADLMKAYLEEIGVDNATEMRAGSDSYVVTVEDGESVVHRKCIVKNGIAVYYDFTYDADSTSKQKYEEHIKYIDSKMK